MARLIQRYTSHNAGFHKSIDTQEAYIVVQASLPGEARRQQGLRAHEGHHTGPLLIIALIRTMLLG